MHATATRPSRATAWGGIVFAVLYVVGFTVAVSGTPDDKNHDNAAKYTAEGGVLDVELRVAAREAVISVRDNGRGIDAGLLPKVFETFTQAALTPDRREGGLGLGLALVRRLTELHGGSVRAESDGVGKGSSFVVVLPLGRAVQAGEAAERA